MNLNTDTPDALATFPRQTTRSHSLGVVFHVTLEETVATCCIIINKLSELTLSSLYVEPLSLMTTSFHLRALPLRRARLAAPTLAQTSSLLITARNVPLHRARQLSSSLASALGYNLWGPTHSSPRCGHRT
eukprot:1784713-Rhodomonas_salina.1